MFIHPLSRRSMLFGAASASALLAGCANSGSAAAVSLATAKTYFEAVSNAMIAAAQEYIAAAPATAASTIATVKAIVTDLESLQTAVSTITVPADWKAGAQEAIADIQQLEPLVAPFLGAAAPYVPLALAVLSSFIAALPMPTNAPATPPQPLMMKAAQVRR